MCKLKKKNLYSCLTLLQQQHPCKGIELFTFYETVLNFRGGNIDVIKPPAHHPNFKAFCTNCTMFKTQSVQGRVTVIVSGENKVAILSPKVSRCDVNPI